MLKVEQREKTDRNVLLDGGPLSIEQVHQIGTNGCRIQLTEDPAKLCRLTKAVELVDRAVDDGVAIYGVTTGFGGMSNVAVSRESAAASQNNLLSFLATGAGAPVDRKHVRAAMAIRANVLMQGRSAVRFEIIERIVRFLKADATPTVRELGSIGASGDLVPLSAIARAVTGAAGSVRVDIGDQQVSGTEALAALQLDPIELRPKEGLAIVNGTSFSSAIAANCVAEARSLMAIAIAAQAMMLRALNAHEEPFEPFVHQCKPHPGQVWVAKTMLQLLQEGRVNGTSQCEPSSDIQDRYSMRCLPQYFGPIVEGVSRVARVVETEMNSVSDNPLVDSESERFYQSGNFLGQYIGIAMDDLRRFLGLMAKHCDVQIATLVAPEFNRGLPGSLRGTDERSYNMGLKGLQITGNSIMPMLTYYGNPIVEHFPTHAEQFNQNINGLGWGSANLAWKSVELFQHYMSIALIFAVQALDLRAHISLGHYDGRVSLGTQGKSLYDAIYSIMDCHPGPDRPFLFHDSDQWLEQKIEMLFNDIRADGAIKRAVAPILGSFDESTF